MYWGQSEIRGDVVSNESSVGLSLDIGGIELLEKLLIFGTLHELVLLEALIEDAVLSTRILPSGTVRIR